MNNYEKYFNLLENNKQEINEIKKCCENQEIIIDNENDIKVCENCGVVLDNNIDLNYSLEKLQLVLNPKFSLTYLIKPKRNFKNIIRLHKWSNYNYHESTAKNDFKIIKKIYIKYNIDIKNFQLSCYLYKKIYIDDKISSRNKIKKALLIYCVFKKNRHIDIFEILQQNNIGVLHFNKLIEKLDENLYLHKEMKIIVDLINKNYQRNININDIITIYNDYKKLFIQKNIRKHKNSNLYVGIFFYLKINKNDIEEIKKFIKIFNITLPTITKFLNKF